MNKPDAPFCLAVKQRCKENDQVLYMPSPLGKYQFGKFLSQAVSAAGLQPRTKKISNHSVRKSSIGRLLEANYPENFVMQLSGHKSIQSLGAYKSASLTHQRQMSNTLSLQDESASSKIRAIVKSLHIQQQRVLPRILCVRPVLQLLAMPKQFSMEPASDP